jgi:transcriptional regulator with XRE-family HTH domain
VQNDIAKQFRQRLRALRKQRGWTQEDAAEMCGIGQKLFQLYESGIKDNPGLRTLEKISEGFGIQVHQLLGPAMPRTRTQYTARKKRR